MSGLDHQHLSPDSGDRSRTERWLKDGETVNLTC